MALSLSSEPVRSLRLICFVVQPSAQALRQFLICLVEKVGLEEQVGFAKLTW